MGNWALGIGHGALGMGKYEIIVGCVTVTVIYQP